MIENYTDSDHKYITFCVRDDRPAPRWNIDKINLERLLSTIAHGQRALKDIPEALPLPVRAKMVTDATVKVIKQACAEAMPRKTSSRSRRPAYWWTDEIADLRKTCLQRRHRMQRVKRCDRDAAPLATEYSAAKKTLKRAMQFSQQRCWRDLGEELDASKYLYLWARSSPLQ